MPAKIVVELSEHELERLDLAVSEGAFESREAAVHAALTSIISPAGDDEIAESYRRAYGRVPEEEAFGEVGRRLAADRLRDER